MTAGDVNVKPPNDGNSDDAGNDDRGQAPKGCPHAWFARWVAAAEDMSVPAVSTCSPDRRPQLLFSTLVAVGASRDCLHDADATTNDVDPMTAHLQHLPPLSAQEATQTLPPMERPPPPTMSPWSRPTVGAVVLTTGSRPADLALALSTLLAQRHIQLDVVVVANGCEPQNLPDGVRLLVLQKNVGVPEGRNIGAARVRGDLILFYDDDATLPTPDVVSRLAAALAAHPRAALVQPRPLDPTGLPSPRRWVPRLRVRDGSGAGVVGVFWEGVFLIRRGAFEQVGCWPGSFFFGHEGIDLAWRLWDADWSLRYEPSIVVRHPARAPHSTPLSYRLDARNRAWVARRNLPAPLALTHVLAWALVTVLRARRTHPLHLWFSGLREGLSGDCGTRRPMRWRTILRLTAAGRPPIF